MPISRKKLTIEEIMNEIDVNIADVDRIHIPRTNWSIGGICTGLVLMVINLFTAPSLLLVIPGLVLIWGGIFWSFNELKKAIGKIEWASGALDMLIALKEKNEIENNG